MGIGEENNMYYMILFIYKKCEYYCIWVSKDIDYVLAEDKKIICFSNYGEMKNYAEFEEIIFDSEDITRYNIDDIMCICELENFDEQCKKILDFWNICSDVANGCKVNFEGSNRNYDSLYEKVFCGNNILNSSQQKYIPRFSESETKALKFILNRGIDIIINALT